MDGEMRASPRPDRPGRHQRPAATNATQVSTRRKETKSQAVYEYEPSFQWPPGFSPAEARLYVRNQLDVEASPASVWLIDAYHAWDLSPSDRGCLVITDETQRGIMPSFLGFALKPRMLAVHDLWLRNLERRARAAGNDG